MEKSSSLPPLEGFFGRKEGGELHLANSFLCIYIVIICEKKQLYFLCYYSTQTCELYQLKLLFLQSTLKTLFVV